MTNTDSITPTDCISLLRRVRDKAATSTTSQLLDYIDGQIDAIESVYPSLAVQSISNKLPHPRAPWEDNEQFQNNGPKDDLLYPRQYTNSAPCDNVSNTVARFRGADMD